jgi:hypothetical protein
MLTQALSSVVAPVPAAVEDPITEITFFWAGEKHGNRMRAANSEMSVRINRIAGVN